MEKAKDIAKERKLEDFVLSSGWLDSFKKPKEILFQAICSESASLDSAQTDEWPKDTLSEILKEYDHNMTRQCIQCQQKRSFL